ATAWDVAARIGLADPRLHAAAGRCLGLVADRAPASLRDAMDRLVGMVERGRCPADDVADEAARTGIAETVARLARRQS
ncbi:MAG: ergothioneine biosynthesis glutamate--cysteine ligase EgtA, partial [Mycobacterium sp.]